MKPFRLSEHFILYAWGIFLAGCNFPGSGNPDLRPIEVIQTAAARTVEAQQTLIPKPQTTATQMISGESLTKTPSSPSPTQLNNISTPFKGTLSPECDRVEFVEDISVPDGSKFAAGENFSKTWRLKNKGTCTWTKAYKLIFTDGDALGGPTTLNLPGNVAPGESIDLSIMLKAPSAPGTYKSFWKLENASGGRFGFGELAEKAFWVEIVVTPGAATPDFFAVTSVEILVSPNPYSGKCPVTMRFTARITSSAAGSVTYFWEGEDGSKSPTQSIQYSAAGTQTASWDRTLGGGPGFTYTGWEKIFIDNPNHQSFPQSSFIIDCTS